jgi:hypothetical protein
VEEEEQRAFAVEEPDMDMAHGIGWSLEACSAVLEVQLEVHVEPDRP